MTFTPKSWGDFGTGGTPLNAAAMVDLETRLSDYSDTKLSADLILDEFSVVADGVTDNAPTINALLTALGTGTAVLSNHNASYYGVNSPIIVPNGVTLKGMGAMQGGSSIKALSAFPTTTISGDQTLPADTTTSFTLTVAATAGFPLGNGGITPAHGTGVICVAGIRIFYTSATATTFTGCRIGGDGVGVTLADGRAVSTAVVWLNDPAGTGGFGTRIENLAVDCGQIAGAGGVHSCHIQEGGGWHNIRVVAWKNFGFAIDDNPSQGTAQHCANYEWGKIWTTSSVNAEPESVHVDIMHSFVGATAGPKIDADRGGFDATMVVMNPSAVVNKAHLRLNGCSGHYGRFHVEWGHIGVLVGDLFRSDVIIDSVTMGGSAGAWGSGTNDAGIQIGAIAGNSVVVRQVRKGNASGRPTMKVLADLTTGFSSVDETLDYRLFQDGVYSVNGGAMVGPLASRPSASTTYTGRMYWPTDTDQLQFCDGSTWFTVAPSAATTAAELVQDSVASGARDSSSATTLVMSVGKTTTPGNLLVVAAGADSARTLSSVADSKGNTWRVDATHSAGGTPTANLASTVISVALVPTDTITLTFTGANTNATATAFEIFSSTGWDAVGTARFDQAKGGNAAGPSVPATGTSAATAQANEVSIAAASCVGASVLTAGPNQTQLASQSSGASLYGVYPEMRILSRVSTYASTWIGSASSWECTSAYYKVL